MASSMFACDFPRPPALLMPALATSAAAGVDDLLPPADYLPPLPPLPAQPPALHRQRREDLSQDAQQKMRELFPSYSPGDRTLKHQFSETNLLQIDCHANVAVVKYRCTSPTRSDFVASLNKLNNEEFMPIADRTIDDQWRTSGDVLQFDLVLGEVFEHHSVTFAGNDGTTITARPDKLLISSVSEVPLPSSWSLREFASWASREALEFRDFVQAIMV